MKKTFTRFVALADECFSFYARPAMRFDRWLNSSSPVALLAGILIMALLSAMLVILAFQFSIIPRVFLIAVDVACSAHFILQTMRKRR